MFDLDLRAQYLGAERFDVTGGDPWCAEAGGDLARPELAREHFLEYCSIRRSDLAVATSLLDADSSPMVAPGRASPGWRHEVLADMATNLAAHDITVLAERAVVEDPAEDRTIGWLTTTNDWLSIIVRVDPTGEVFSRVDPDQLTL